MEEEDLPHKAMTARAPVVDKIRVRVKAVAVDAVLLLCLMRKLVRLLPKEEKLLTSKELLMSLIAKKLQKLGKKAEADKIVFQKSGAGKSSAPVSFK
jgi:hypothetical protein